MKKALKTLFFKSTVQSVLLYGSSTWALNQRLEGRTSENKRCDQRTEDEVQWKLLESKDEVILKGLLWRPTHGKRSRGRPSRLLVNPPKDST